MSACAVARWFALCAFVLVGLACTSTGPGGGNGNPVDDGDELVASDTLGGTVAAADVSIPAGQTTRVVSDLVIQASGDVRIDGTLVADPTSGTGFSITILADGDIDVTGSIQAGDGMSAKVRGKTQRTLADGADEDPAEGESLAGADGGTVRLEARGNLNVSQAAVLTSGSGTDGQEGHSGNGGGDGGHLILRAGGQLNMRGSLAIGNGGNGGLVLTTPDDLSESSDWDNSGGSAGLLVMSGNPVDMPGLVTRGTTTAGGKETPYLYEIDPMAYAANPSTGMIWGGIGGAAGEVIISDLGPQASPVQAPPDDQGLPEEICPAGFKCARGAIGGWGWWYGGAGGSVTITVAYEHAGADGTSWRGTGGEGGPTDEERAQVLAVDFSDTEQGEGLLPTSGWSLPVVLCVSAQAGLGGLANVTAPSGEYGSAGQPHAGHGGHAYAQGGRGGAASLYTPQTAGEGGQAFAYAGDGGFGHEDPCGPGAGGNGGNATAMGGWGGDGITPGAGGDAHAIGGHGGQGGGGSPQAGGGGAGGTGGRQHSEGGCFGGSPPEASVQPCGLITDEFAPDGDPGSDWGFCEG